MTHFVLVLSHMLQRDGSLNEESTKRASKGAEIFKAENADFIITSGGNERVHGENESCACALTRASTVLLGTCGACVCSGPGRDALFSKAGSCGSGGFLSLHRQPVHHESPKEYARKGVHRPPRLEGHVAAQRLLRIGLLSHVALAQPRVGRRGRRLEQKANQRQRQGLSASTPMSIAWRQRRNKRRGTRQQRSARPSTPKKTKKPLS